MPVKVTSRRVSEPPHDVREFVLPTNEAGDWHRQVMAARLIGTSQDDPWGTRCRSSRSPKASLVVGRQLQGYEKSLDGVPIWVGDAAFKLLNAVLT